MEQRLTISTKDVMRITGKGIRYAQRKFRLIRDVHQKHAEAEITIKEYCDYEGMNVDEVKAFLGIK